MFGQLPPFYGRNDYQDDSCCPVAQCSFNGPIICCSSCLFGLFVMVSSNKSSSLKSINHHKNWILSFSLDTFSTRLSLDSNRPSLIGHSSVTWPRGLPTRPRRACAPGAAAFPSSWAERFSTTRGSVGLGVLFSSVVPFNPLLSKVNIHEEKKVNQHF